jgi:transcriptional regulator with XRE-family HTH domain
MALTRYEVTTMLLIKTFRKVRYIKQAEVAYALNMSEANYSKLEAGFWSVKFPELLIICNTIGIALVQLIALVDAYENLDHNITPLSRTLVSIIKTVENDKGEVIMDKVQLHDVISKIRLIDLSSLIKAQYAFV